MSKAVKLRDVLEPRVERSGLQRQEIARRAGITPSYLTALLKGRPGKQALSEEVAVRLAEVLASDPQDRAGLLDAVRPFFRKAREKSLGSRATLGSTLGRVDRNRSFTAGVIHYPPFVDLKNGPEPSGYVIDIFQQIRTLAHVRIDYTPTSYDSMHRDLAVGRIDVVLGGVFRTMSRSLQMRFVPLRFVDAARDLHDIVGCMAAVLRKNDARKLQTEQLIAGDLENCLITLIPASGALPVGVIRGEFGEDITSVFLPNARKVHLTEPTSPDILGQLDDGTVQVIICDALTAQRIVQDGNGRLAQLPIRFDSGSGSQRTLYEPDVGLSVRHADTDWRDFLKDAVETVTHHPAPAMAKRLLLYAAQLGPLLRPTRTPDGLVQPLIARSKKRKENQ